MPIGIPLSIKLLFRSGTCLSEIWAQLISVFLMFFLSFNTFFKAAFRRSSNDCSVWKDWERKNATGNSILGFECFKDSPSGSSATQFCNANKRKEEREVTVIDTPGIMDTVPVTTMEKVIEKAKSMTGFKAEKQTRNSSRTRQGFCHVSRRSWCYFTHH